MTKALKPCPLCGLRFERSEAFSNRTRAIYVHPPELDGAYPCPLENLRIADNDGQRIQAWNRRADTADQERVPVGEVPELWMWLVDVDGEKRIRKWQTAPFDQGVRYALPGTPEAETLTAHPMETAPRDNTMVFLLVDYVGDLPGHPLVDDNTAWTIGFNSFDLSDLDEWKFAGWCWSHDHFTQGQGRVLGWAPMPSLEVVR